MSIQGKWRIVEMPDYESNFPDMMGQLTSCSTKRAVSSLLDALPVRSTGPSTALRSSSLGPATTKWTKPVAMDGPSFKMMAPSKDRFASKAAMKPTSLPSLGRLLQQPARALAAEADRVEPRNDGETDEEADN